MSNPIDDTIFMSRALDLAARGGHRVGTNPKVGCVIVHHDRIIGEGYHQKYGGPHAEVHAINSVSEEDRPLLKEAHMFVSLEPCHHHGKTPPCCDLILKHHIPELTIALVDPNPLTSHKSIDKLRASGVKVHLGLMSQEARWVTRRFLARQTYGRPYIILKWAQSKDRYIGQADKQVWLSNPQSKLLVHRWRDQVDAIMVGTNTILTDDPQLTTRVACGRSPLRIILDRRGIIPPSAKVFDDDSYHIFTTSHPDEGTQITSLSENDWSLDTILQQLYKYQQVGSILVEGGAALLRSFIKHGLWDEARIIQTPILLHEGIKAPTLKGIIRRTHQLKEDKVLIINNLHITKST